MKYSLFLFMINFSSTIDNMSEFVISSPVSIKYILITTSKERYRCVLKILNH